MPMEALEVDIVDRSSRVDSVMRFLSLFCIQRYCSSFPGFALCSRHQVSCPFLHSLFCA
jgi:hypothetical protein